MQKFITCDEIRQTGYGRQNTTDDALAKSFKTKILQEAREKGVDLYAMVLIAGKDYVQDGTRFTADRTGVFYTNIEGVAPSAKRGREGQVFDLDGALEAGEEWDAPVAA